MDGGWARWVTGIKEGACSDEHWVLYVSDESLNSTPERNITLYVINKTLEEKKRSLGGRGGRMRWVGTARRARLITVHL